MKVALPAGDVNRARELAGELFHSGYDPLEPGFFATYKMVWQVTFRIATGIEVSLPLSREAIGLLWAEFEQDAGEIARAVEIVESLEPSTLAAVSLAELYAEEERWNDIVSLTDNLTNQDDASTFLLIQRGSALRELGHYEAARTALKEALRVRSRPVELRRLAYVTRGRTYAAEGKKSMARKDYERVLAEDSMYPDLSELLSEVA